MSTAELVRDAALGLGGPGSNLSAQDRKDLEKFTKYFVFKCIQVVIQSRLGVRLHTQSKHLSTGSDWFNLCIRDHSDVLAESKKLYTGFSSLTDGNRVCVEISVKTVDGEEMVLETWSVELTEEADPNSRVSFIVYNRMGVVLKSLMSVSRSMPGYKLSRRQGPDSFVVLYRMYMGPPDVSHLGDGFRRQGVGVVPTPAGMVRVSVAYRTQLLLSPRVIAADRDLSSELNADHFVAENDKRKGTCDGVSRHEAMHVGDMVSPSERRLSDDRFGVQRVAAFASNASTESDIDSSEGANIPFSRLLECSNDIPSSDSKSENLCGTESSMERSSSIQAMQVTTSGSGVSLHSGSTSSCKSPPPPAAPHPPTDNFVMLELRTPFAGSDEDLGRFYRDCQAAPVLAMFQGGGEGGEGVQHMLNSITDQLTQFEANAKEFDEFVSSIQELDVN